MSKAPTQEAIPVSEAVRVGYYGDEQERLDTLRDFDYDDFKHFLIEAHNTHPDISRESTFTSVQNRNSGGDLFPCAEDKDSLLEYALEQAQAQEDVQISALILGAAIVAVHPFIDGNGRTSRAVYSYLSRGHDDTSEEHRQVRTQRNKAIEFMNVTDEGHGLANWYVYADSGVPKIADQAWYRSQDSEAAKKHYAEREYHGLSEQERQTLDMLLGEKYGDEGDDKWPPARLGATGAAILYGFSKFAAVHNVELLTNTAGAGHTQINTPDTLATMSGDDKRELTGYIQQYFALEAKAGIDLMGKHGDQLIDVPGSEMTIRSYLLTKTKNYLASPYSPAKA